MNIVLGYLIKNHTPRNLVTIPWDNIGILVVGRPGSGKSHVIASMLTQYVLKGADVIVAEYNADPSNEQSLLYRIKHLHVHLLKPPVTSGNDIVKLIQWIKQELTLRQQGKSPRTPLIVVLDEFFQFAASVKVPEEVNIKKQGDARSDEGETITKQKAPSFWEDLLSAQTDMRKNNIRIILAAQETSSTATSNLMRQVRDMFRFKLIMNLSPKGADLLGITDRAAQRLIDSLKRGRIYVNGSIIGVPYPINPEWIDAVHRLPIKQRAEVIPEQHTWDTEELRAYFKALLEDEPKLQIIKDHKPWSIQSLEDVIELLLLLGWSNNRIEQLFATARASLRQLVKDIKTAKLI